MYLEAHPGRGGVLPYVGHIGMCRSEGYGFQAVYSSIGYIKSERLGLEWAIIFHETDHLIEDFNYTKETRNCYSKI